MVLLWLVRRGYLSALFRREDENRAQNRLRTFYVAWSTIRKWRCVTGTFRRETGRITARSGRIAEVTGLFYSRDLSIPVCEPESRFPVISLCSEFFSIRDRPAGFVKLTTTPINISDLLKRRYSIAPGSLPATLQKYTSLRHFFNGACLRALARAT